MSDSPILLFLHGVGDGDPADKWKAQLQKTLLKLEFPDLEPVQVIAPKYADSLLKLDEPPTDSVPKDVLPPIIIKPQSGDKAKANRRDFERRVGAVEFRLGRYDAGAGWIGGDFVIDAALALPVVMRQARRYATNTLIRARVLKKVLHELPESGELVIVGHSLGSVIAADLLPRLPAGIRVTGLITIGSPVGHGRFDVSDLRTALKDPPTNLGWWINFWSWIDPVTSHRGVSSVFPWMVDLRISTTVGAHMHDAVEYLRDDSVADAIGFGLFGSRSTEIATLEGSQTLRPDAIETTALLALRYAHLVLDGLEGEQRNRFAGALRTVQMRAVDDIRRRNAAEGRDIPWLMARLGFDFSDPECGPPQPLPMHHMTKDDAVVLLTVLHLENVIAPFEMPSIKKERWLEALRDLTAEMGLSAKFGSDVSKSAQEARQVLTGSGTLNWVKWTALGAGAVALVVATGGLVLAAGVGLAGAAAVTSALAAFGPGGMIGGLITAGTLASAGGGGIALGLASSSTTAETVEAVVARQLTAVIVRKRQGLEQDPAVWANLVETEIALRREKERLDEFSDPNAPVLKELTRKIEAIERALAYIEEHGLQPLKLDDSPDDEFESSGAVRTAGDLLNGIRAKMPRREIAAAVPDEDLTPLEIES